MKTSSEQVLITQLLFKHLKVNSKLLLQEKTGTYFKPLHIHIFTGVEDIQDPGGGAEDFSGSANTLCDAIVLETHPYTLVPPHRMYDAKGDPQYKLWPLSDYDGSKEVHRL